MKILVCGGRDFGLNKTERDFIFQTLDNFVIENKLITEKDEYGNFLPSGVTIISGKARGVDTVAIDWATINWTPCLEFPADWETHGKKAGWIRNKQMLEEGEPDVVIAFNGGKGTKNMCYLAEQAGVPVVRVKYDQKGE